jgi:hypothetical protein
MSNMDFSSWPRDQEQSFVVYEERANDSQRKAFTLGIVVALAAFVIAVGIYAGVEPDKKDVTKGMNMSNLTKSTKKVESEAAAPTPAPQTPAAPAEKTPSGESGSPK